MRTCMRRPTNYTSVMNMNHQLGIKAAKVVSRISVELFWLIHTATFLLSNCGSLSLRSMDYTGSTSFSSDLRSNQDQGGLKWDVDWTSIFDV